MANKDRVYEDYDIIANWFDDVRMRDLGFEKPYLDIVSALTKQGGTVLDLGCGMGEPVARYFIENGFQVTGVDGSSKMIEKARGYVPEAKFYVQDMRHLDLDDKFDAIVLWHSLFHLPHEDQREMFKGFEDFMNPGGILLFTSDYKAGETWSNNGGENLYHASLALSEYMKLLESHYFELVCLNVKDKNCGEATIWVSQFRG